MSGAAPPPEEDLNYLFEMVKAPVNGWALAGGLIAGSIASIAVGVPGLILLPAIVQAGANGLMALFLPESPVFRAGIDRKKRRQRREAMRRHIVSEIQRRFKTQHKNWEVYEGMRQQLYSLRQTVKTEETTLSEWDVERMDDTTVNFLRLWLARLSIAERQDSVDVSVLGRRARSIEKQIAAGDLSVVDRKRLEQAGSDLDKILKRHRSFGLQDTALSASMLSIADGFSEVYHRVMSNPAGADLSSFMNNAVDRMNVTEELDFAADAELEALLGESKAARKAAKKALKSAPAESEAMRLATEASGQAAQKQKSGQ